MFWLCAFPFLYLLVHRRLVSSSCWHWLYWIFWMILALCFSNCFNLCWTELIKSNSLAKAHSIWVSPILLGLDLILSMYLFQCCSFLQQYVVYSRHPNFFALWSGIWYLYRANVTMESNNITFSIKIRSDKLIVKIWCYFMFEKDSVGMIAFGSWTCCMIAIIIFTGWWKFDCGWHWILFIWDV